VLRFFVVSGDQSQALPIERPSTAGSEQWQKETATPAPRRFAKQPMQGALSL
jgi:hypothetical protein